MALHLKLKPKSLTPIRLLSSSISPSPPPPPPPPDDSNGGGQPKPPSSPSFSSHFSDIKQSLKTPPSPPRRIPTEPFPPSPPFPSSPNPPAPYTNDIRRQLAEFRLKSPNPNPNPNPGLKPNHTMSFQELFKNSVAANKPGSNPSGKPDGGGGSHTFDSIRESLRQFHPRENTGTRSSFHNSFNLRSFQESLRSPSISADRLPESIFGRELREKNKGYAPEAEAAAAEGETKALNTEFVKMYSCEELGEKLRRLRPAAAGKAGKDWFSLKELNGRLVKLRELEVKETNDTMGGLSFRELRESLVRLKEVDDNKKVNMHRLSILTNLGTNATPDFMLKPPQEQLIENYFHPDHLSSAEKMKMELQKVRDEFKMSESDCGSSRVQIAQLTTKIKHLSSVLHKKDKHSRKGLHEMVQRRKKLLKYLRRTDWDSYCLVLSKLGLRDVPEYKTPNYKT